MKAAYLSQKIIKIVNIQDIGQVSLCKSKRAKKFRISIKPDRTVTVTIPKSASFKSGENIAHSKIDWIKKCLDKLKDNQSKKVIFNNSTNFITKKHQLFLQQSNIESVETEITDSKIIIKYPLSVEASSPDFQKEVRKAIIEVLRIEAKEYIPLKVQEFGELYNFKFKNIYIKNIKSRWGSCSSVNNLNFNLQLMRISSHLIDYVILHELAHTIEKNHGEKFWSLLNSITNNRAKQLDKELKKFKIDF